MYNHSFKPIKHPVNRNLPSINSNIKKDSNAKPPLGPLSSLSSLSLGLPESVSIDWPVNDPFRDIPFQVPSLLLPESPKKHQIRKPVSLSTSRRKVIPPPPPPPLIKAPEGERVIDVMGISFPPGTLLHPRNGLAIFKLKCKTVGRGIGCDREFFTIEQLLRHKPVCGDPYNETEELLKQAAELSLMDAALGQAVIDNHLAKFPNSIPVASLSRAPPSTVKPTPPLPPQVIPPKNKKKVVLTVNTSLNNEIFKSSLNKKVDEDEYVQNDDSASTSSYESSDYISSSEEEDEGRGKKKKMLKVKSSKVSSNSNKGISINRRSFSDVAPYKCPHCDREFDLKFNFEYHYDSKHVDGFRWRCHNRPGCTINSFRESDFNKAHKGKGCSGEGKRCIYDIETPIGIYENASTQPPGSLPCANVDNENAQFICPIHGCTYRTDVQSSFLNHLDKEEGAYYSCSIPGCTLGKESDNGQRGYSQKGNFKTAHKKSDCNGEPIRYINGVVAPNRYLINANVPAAVSPMSL